MIRLKNLVQSAAIQLYDENQSNWSEPELIFWIEEALGALAALRPDLFTKTETIPLVPGGRQETPAESARIIRVLGTRESESGPMRSVTRFDMRSMNAAHPNWEAASPGKARQYTTRSDADVFWLYPPQPDPAHYAVVEHVAIPQTVDHDAPEYDTFEIDLDPRFQRSLVDYVLYRAYAKDSDVGAQGQRAMTHYQAFYDGSGAAQQQEQQPQRRA